MTKKISHDEVDVLDLFLVVWNKKLIIVYFTIFAMILGFFYKSFSNDKSISIIKSEIRPITVYEQAKYSSYNSFIKALLPYSLSEVEKYTFNNLDSLLGLLKKNSNENNLTEEIDESILNTSILLRPNMNKTDVVSNFEIKDVDRFLLFNLFIDKVRQKSKLKEYIIKSKLIDENDIKKMEEFENSVYKIKSTLRNYKVYNNEKNKKAEINPIFIQFETENTEELKKFLIFLEKEVNIEIQRNIRQMFDSYVQYVRSINEFMLEDINDQLSLVNNPLQRELLETRKKFLIADKYIERIIKIYQKSPISENQNFYAAKIVYDLDIKETDNSLKKILILCGILGAIFGIFVILISNAVKSRRLS